MLLRNLKNLMRLALLYRRLLPLHQYNLVTLAEQMAMPRRNRSYGILRIIFSETIPDDYESEERFIKLYPHSPKMPQAKTS